MSKEIVDKKDPISFFLLSLITKIVLFLFFRKIQVRGLRNIPRKGPFICVANHSSRFDGPVLGRILDRPANFMVSPNELKGLQGTLLRKVGSFPSNPRHDFVSFVLSRFGKQEPFVIFPEGNVFYDGHTHKFKKGVAKVAFAALLHGMNVPIVPVAIGYNFQGQWQARFNFGEPIYVQDYLALYEKDKDLATNNLLTSLHREVLSLRAELGCKEDEVQLLESGENFKLPLGNQLVGDLQFTGELPHPGDLQPACEVQPAYDWQRVG